MLGIDHILIHQTNFGSVFVGHNGLPLPTYPRKTCAIMIYLCERKPHTKNIINCFREIFGLKCIKSKQHKQYDNINFWRTQCFYFFLPGNLNCNTNWIPIQFTLWQIFFYFIEKLKMYVKWCDLLCLWS